MFLSKTLSPPERRYWPTELEVACLVWTTKRVRWMVEACEKPVTVLTDHSATIGIVRQTSLTSSSVDKLNNRLTRASQYLSQFGKLRLVYVPGREHILPDALSRLNAAETTKVRDDEDTLDDLVMSNAIEFVTTAYGTTMLTEIQDDFRRQLQTGYDEDKHFSRFKTLAQKHPDSTAFAWRDDLLWFNERLCIPKTLVGDIFQTVHDEQYHVGYHRIYPRLQGQFYIRKLDKLLRRYLQHCPECQEVQTKRHRPFGALQPIFSPAIPFHTITIDFILGLPEVNDFNSILSVTCKFSKRVILLPGHDTYTASAWGHRLLDELLSADWGLPTVIISDRDPKFLSQVWKTIFDRLGTKLVTNRDMAPPEVGGRAGPAR